MSDLATSTAGAATMPGAIFARTEQVEVRRGGRLILQVDDLAVRKGEVVAIIGPNGAGKSTLLRVLGLLERPDAGRVLYGGVAVAGPRVRVDQTAARRRTAAVFQDPLLLDMSVVDNVTLGLRLRGVARGAARERAIEWLGRLDVHHLAPRTARQLSGGEAQRVALARALVLAPDLLLLDEPFAALDAPTRGAILTDLAGLLRGATMATVLVTHDRNEALVLGDSIALMLDGRIVQQGKPDEVFSRPVDERAAAFVGVETIIPGSVVAQADGLATIDCAGLTVEAVSDIAAGRHVLVLLRPEDIVIEATGRPAGTTSARNHAQGAVRRIVPLGAQARVEILVGSHMVVALVTRRSLDDLRLEVASVVSLSFKATAVHVLPRGD